ncbi:MAG: DUF4185 domain-containing protein [Draconibacterium sp.]
MKQFLLIVFFWRIFIQTIDGQSNGDSKINFEISTLDNSVFKRDNFWRGADGAATIDLENGKILWLFSDTFIDTAGTGKRVGSKMINNTLAIQQGVDLQKSGLEFFWKGTHEKPKSFFDLPGDTWFWTGHGTIVNGKLLVFLFEEKSSTEGLGFESVGWTLAIIANPNESPENWKIDYVKGPYDFGVIVGSSAVLKDEHFVYAYGVKEPGNHETYLLRFEKNKLSNGDLTSMEWWTGNKWEDNITEVPKSAILFEGQTEFSVHFDHQLKKYIQIQTFGFGHASLGFRLADKLQGPWSEPTIFYSPKLQTGEFNYTANAHPELRSDGILITYNVNNFNFDKLINNENIYFPRLVLLKMND